LIASFVGREAEFMLRRAGDHLAGRVTVADIDARILLLRLRREIVARARLR
jgi:hypothetical protein